MRGTRWLVLVAIVAILCGVGLTWRAQKKVLKSQAPPRPQALPADIVSSGEKWQYTKTNEDTHCKIVDIFAGGVQQTKDSSRVDLQDVTLMLYHDCAKTYDLAKSAAATFYPADNRLYSEGAVEITRGVPVSGQPAHALVSIRPAGGVFFDTNTARIETDRPCSFAFQNGGGQSTGASYDPAAHNLFLKSDVKLEWKPAGPAAKLMKIEAGSGEYREPESEIWLKPWGRLTRENTVVEGQNAVVYIQDDASGHKVIRKVVANMARGSDTYPNRKLQYAADDVWVYYDDDGRLQKITAQTNAQLVSTSAASETSIAASHVDLNFEPLEDDSVLSNVWCSGHAVVTSRPLPAPGRQLPETQVLRSETLEMKMRPGGREIDNVVTHGPGTLEFLPNLPAQHHRLLEGRDMVFTYGPQNYLETFRAAGVKTRTDPTPDELKRHQPVSITSSRDLLAHFNPQTGRLASMEQSGDFTYDEGDRKARAAKATLDSNQNLLLLDDSARIWDPTGSTSADHIRLDRRSGDFTAEGRVISSRLPDKDQNKNSQLLSGDEPLQAQARKMVSTSQNRDIHYEGGVTMWQGANRIQGDTIDVDRQKRGLMADGHVVTSLWEQPKDPSPGAAAPAPVLTIVHAPHLVYTDDDRQAVYTGGVLLTRGGLRVNSRELRAFLAESGADSRLEKALADGAVEMVETAKDRTRTGTAAHSEYYTAVQKVVLRGGRPKLVDVKGASRDVTQGDELTYFANDDRLLVNGSPNQPAASQLHKSK